MRDVAVDGVEYLTEINDQQWRVSWHPPDPVPEGRPHGAEAVCLAQGRVVLVSRDGELWGQPAGRPEQGESWADTMRREVAEEACAEVTEARLLGFSRGVCVQGHEQGLVLVRSMWRAEVRLLRWEPRFEMAYRRLVLPGRALASIVIPPGAGPFNRRFLTEAGIVSR